MVTLLVSDLSRCRASGTMDSGPPGTPIADTCLKAIWIRFHSFATDQPSLKQVATCKKVVSNHDSHHRAP
eukprot:scaffold44947_cov81-Cyclotella_meneghiniana.AAC.4